MCADSAQTRIDAKAHALPVRANLRTLLLLRVVVRVAVVFALRLVVGEVDLAREVLALAEDLEPGGRVDRALVLDRHLQLLVDADAFLLELELRDYRLLAALVVDLIARAEQALAAAAELVELDRVLDVVERPLEECSEVDHPGMVGLVFLEVRRRLLLALRDVRRLRLRRRREALRRRHDLAEEHPDREIIGRCRGDEREDDQQRQRDRPHRARWYTNYDSSNVR